MTEFNREILEGAGGAVNVTHIPVSRENPNKRLVSPWAGDKPTVDELKLFNAGHGQGMRHGRQKRRAQKLELRRLNLVIQQMSWKLHRRRRSDVELQGAWFFIGASVGVSALVIFRLVFS